MSKNFTDYHQLADYVVGEIQTFRQEYLATGNKLKRLEKKYDMVFEALVKQQELLVTMQTELGFKQDSHKK
jgi:hypothetical protein